MPSMLYYFEREIGAVLTPRRLPLEPNGTSLPGNESER